MKKIQLPAIGGIRKVIEIPDAGTTITEIGSGSITLAQLAKLITVQQQNATPVTSNTVGDGTEAVLKVGPNLSGGGVMLGTVKIRNDYFSPAYALAEDARGAIEDPPPQLYPPAPRAAPAAPMPPWWVQNDSEFDESMLPIVNYPASSGGGSVSFANPTASVGLSAVNGSATTAMRSDAAPALSQAIAPTWTATHTFTPSSSAIAVVMNGASGQWTQDLYGNGGTGNSYGLRMHAGTNSSDYALQIINGSYSALYMAIVGDGSGQLGPGTSLSLKWDASGNFTFPAKISMNAPSSGVALTVPGASGYYALQVVANNTSGSSYGLEINGGLNSSDAALLITNQGVSATYMKIVGDGSGQLGPGTSSSLKWDSSGNFTFPAKLALNAPASGVALSVSGASGSYTLQVIGSNSSGNSYGLEINAGLTSGDAALLVTNQGLSATYMKINGDGSGQMGPGTSSSLKWDASGNFTFNGTGTPVTINASASQVGLQINGNTNALTAGVQGSTTTGESFGLLVQAGTNSSDTAFDVNKATGGATHYFTIRGDGSIALNGNTYQGVGTINATGLYVGGVAVSTATGANPSASVGLSATNGSATTFMRSDGAPALSQSIAPTWTGDHIFNGTGTPITINASASQVGIQINAGSGQWGLAVQGNTTAGSSYGTLLQAGANSSDITLQVKNAAASRTYAQISGDGTGFLGNNINGTSATAISWDSSGNVSIGSNSSGGLYVNQAATLQGSSVKVSSLGTGTVYSNSGVLTNTNPSDANLKEGIETLRYGLAEVMQMRPVKFRYRGEPMQHFGFIAQEVQPVMPDAILESKRRDETYLGLDKDAIYGALVNAVQELARKVESHISSH